LSGNWDGRGVSDYRSTAKRGLLGFASPSDGEKHISMVSAPPKVRKGKERIALNQKRKEKKRGKRLVSDQKGKRGKTEIMTGLTLS